MPPSQRIVQGCLAGLGLALLLVGAVSGTILRHLVQIVPIVLAFGLLVRRPSLGAYAAMPIFSFWIFIVVLIWLFLLGLSRIASGQYSVVEIILTIFMAAFSVAGLVKAIPLGRSLRPMARTLTIVSFGVLQVAAMWVSLLRPIASR